jgi:hypothetical protein
MSETRDKRRRTDLDIFILALIDSGVSTPYEFQKAAGLSQGATIPALQLGRPVIVPNELDYPRSLAYFNQTEPLPILIPCSIA